MENTKLKQEIMNRMSISTIIYKDRPLDEKALTLIAEAGIKNIEILECAEQFDFASEKSMKSIREMCKNAGVSIISYHSHLINFTGVESEEARRKLVDISKRQIDTMMEAGGTIWASHARLSDQSVIKSHQELAQYVEGTTVKLAIENFVGPGMWIEDRIKLLEEINHPQVGFLLDVGHVRNTMGQNPMTISGGPARMLELCKEKLFHVHLHGFKDGVDHHPPLCSGDEIQWEELIPYLWKIGYNGYINFEPRGLPRHADSLELTSKMADIIVDMLGNSSKK